MASRHKSLTLIELLISLAVFSIAIVGIFSSFLNSSKVSDHLENYFYISVVNKDIFSKVIRAWADGSREDEFIFNQQFGNKELTSFVRLCAARGQKNVYEMGIKNTVMYLTGHEKEFNKYFYFYMQEEESE